MRKRAERSVNYDSSVIEDFLVLDNGLFALFGHTESLRSNISWIQSHGYRRATVCLRQFVGNRWLQLGDDFRRIAPQNLLLGAKGREADAFHQSVLGKPFRAIVFERLYASGISLARK